MRSYLADGDVAVLDEPQEYDPTQDPDSPEYQDQFEQQIQQAGPGIAPAPFAAPRPVPVGAPQEMAAPVPYLDTDDPGAPGQSPIPDGSIAMPAPHLQQPGSDRYTGALDRLEKLQAQYPEKTPPKWWQRAIAGGIGGLAGWSNAAGRTRNPIDIAAMAENIQHPGYASKLEQWKSKVVPAQAAAEIEGQRAASGWKGQQIQSEAALKTAQAQAAMQHGQYWLSRSEQERNQWKIDPKSGTLYNTITGQITSKPLSAQDRRDTALALIPESDPDRMAKAAFYALNGKMPVPAQHNVSEWQSYLDANGGDSKKALAAKQADEIHRSIASRDPAIADIRQDVEDRKKKAELDNIGNWKINEEKAITQHRDQQLAGLSSNSRQNVDIQAETRRINSQTAAALQNVQNEFAQRGRARGVKTDDYDVSVDNAGNIGYAPRVAPQQPAPGPVAPQPPRLQLKNELRQVSPAASAPGAATGRGGAPGPPRAVVGQSVMVDGKPAVVTAINPKTGKPIVRFK